ncbi:MAG: hypothetical protein IJ559_02510 [Prevotella sp.]|nr:hypothetical protein [Prevotella sp.]
MKEEQLNSLRQQDNALREALRQDEAELPQMPADLNARLMKRMAQEKPVAKTRRLWPWVAAACVAAFIIVNIMPPKASPPAPLAKERGVVTPDTHRAEKPMIAEVEREAAQPAAAPTKAKKAKARTNVVKHDVALLAQETTATESVTPEVKAEEEAKPELAQAVTQDAKPMTLTERDIPITRPENYKYTPEEIALLKKQADEAYLKWVELELEIAKHHLEQTAQQ